MNGRKKHKEEQRERERVEREKGWNLRSSSMKQIPSWKANAHSQNHWVSELCPLPQILETRTITEHTKIQKPDVSPSSCEGTETPTLFDRIQPVIVQLLMLDLSERSPHLKTERDPVSETLCGRSPENQ
jgi:hypothetical protein